MRNQLVTFSWFTWKTHHRKSRQTKLWQHALLVICTCVTWKMHPFSANQMHKFFFMYIIKGQTALYFLCSCSLLSTWNHLLNILYTYIPDVMERYSSEDEAPSITFSNWQKEIKHSIYHRNMMMKYCLSLEFFWVITHVNIRTKYLTPRANKVVLCYWLHRVHMCHT